MNRFLKIYNEGHDASGNLICKVGIDTAEEFKKLFEWVRENFVGGEDHCLTDAPYTVAQGFSLFPRGVNQESFTFSDMFFCDETLEEACELIDPKYAVVYFDIKFEDYNLESDKIEHYENKYDKSESLKVFEEMLQKIRKKNGFEKVFEDYAMIACEFEAIDELKEKWKGFFEE